MSNFNVTIDERLRLVTAVLAISSWAEDEQNRLPHAVHSQAKQLRHFLRPFSSHPAVNGANEALLNGVALSDLFNAALRCTWPEFNPTGELPQVLKIQDWVHLLADFTQDTNISTDFWPQQTAVWDEAVTGLESIFPDDGVMSSLALLTEDSLETAVTLMPNLIFPALTPVVATADGALTLLLPPPKAVGESPPWPFDEDPGWVVATACKHLIPHLLAAELAQLEDDQQAVAVHTAVAHCLSQLLDDFEAQSYLLRSKKAHNLPQLPTLFARLQEAVEGGNGHPLATLFH
jgi:hypothetical protein